ncbi:NAD(P)-dependent oxidoreductase, partial [Paenibacillus sp. P3E]|uniref:sugar nucleotide-binding protein n=1 Tax=Paenibacillus sp. P3E TaxID=1349435 RepID=UPI00093EFFE6
MKYLILGAAGMAGHTISLYLHEQGYEVTTFTRSYFPIGKNIIGDAYYNLDLLSKVILEGDFTVVVNCIGLLNQYAEDNKQKAVFLNSYLPHYISDLTKEMRTRVIHMSTDCVFSGKKGNYIEDSFKDGETFYDRSKALGELDNAKDLTLRNSIIGQDMNVEGIGLFNWFMKQSNEVNGYSRAMWSGVTTLTLAKAIEKAALVNLVGIYHLVNNESISKFNLLSLFNAYFKGNK